MFPRRRRMTVIARRVDAVLSIAKASWVSMQPGATRVDDDVTPEPRRLGHGGMVERGCRECKEPRCGIRGGTSTFAPAWTGSSSCRLGKLHITKCCLRERPVEQ